MATEKEKERLMKTEERVIILSTSSPCGLIQWSSSPAHSHKHTHTRGQWTLNPHWFDWGPVWSCVGRLFTSSAYSARTHSHTHAAALPLSVSILPRTTFYQPYWIYRFRAFISQNWQIQDFKRTVKQRSNKHKITDIFYGGHIHKQGPATPIKLFVNYI